MAKVLGLACLLFLIEDASAASYHVFGTHRTISTIIMVKSGQLGRGAVVGEFRSSKKDFIPRSLTAGELKDLFHSNKLWTANWASFIRGPWFNGNQVRSIVDNFNIKRLFLSWIFQTDQWLEQDLPAPGIILVPKQEGPEPQFRYSSLIETGREHPKHQPLLKFIEDLLSDVDCRSQLDS